MTNNVYYTFLGIDDADFSSKATSATNNLGASSPTAGTYSDIDYHSGFIFSNGRQGHALHRLMCLRYVQLIFL